MALSFDEALFFMDHLFLPPKLPDKADKDHGAKKLLTHFATAARKYGESLDPATRLEWRPIANSIGVWREMYHSGGSCETLIQQRIKLMDHKCKSSPFYLNFPLRSLSYPAFVPSRPEHSTSDHSARVCLQI